MRHLLQNKDITENWEQIKHMFKEKTYPPKSFLLMEGDISKNVYFVIEGCLRLCFNDDGKDITIQLI